MKFLTTVDVARRSGLTRDAIRKAVLSGKLQVIRAESGVFIFQEADVERWLKSRLQKAAARARASAGDAA